MLVHGSHQTVTTSGVGCQNCHGAWARREEKKFMLCGNWLKWYHFSRVSNLCNLQQLIPFQIRHLLNGYIFPINAIGRHLLPHVQIEHLLNTFIIEHLLNSFPGGGRELLALLSFVMKNAKVESSSVEAVEEGVRIFACKEGREDVLIFDGVIFFRLPLLFLFFGCCIIICFGFLFIDRNSIFTSICFFNILFLGIATICSSLFAGFVILDFLMGSLLLFPFLIFFLLFLIISPCFIDRKS
mmetsp:Transcript_39286/g.66960  ORF Transcript_39286/g.66960 Transcript_39286/m.66960 type:complete len:241 (-) Transcript_39286:404-1126(-)